MNINGLNIVLREFQPAADRAFVGSTWLRAVMKFSGQQRRDYLYTLLNHHVDHDAVRVACLDDDPNVIVGFSVLRQGDPMFAYTVRNDKLNFRGHGLARALTAGAP